LIAMLHARLGAEPSTTVVAAPGTDLRQRRSSPGSVNHHRRRR
jgi:hypothetical protein